MAKTVEQVVAADIAVVEKVASEVAATVEKDTPIVVTAAVATEKAVEPVIAATAVVAEAETEAVAKVVEAKFPSWIARNYQGVLTGALLASLITATVIHFLG